MSRDWVCVAVGMLHTTAIMAMARGTGPATLTMSGWYSDGHKGPIPPCVCLGNGPPLITTPRPHEGWALTLGGPVSGHP